MKKKKLKNLSLNKKKISTLQSEKIDGGIVGLTWICTVSVSQLICGTTRPKSYYEEASCYCA